MTVKLSGRRCQCAACGKFFSGDTAFDRHRVGKIVDVAPDYDRRCMDDGEMEKSGLKLNGVIWRWAKDRDGSTFGGASA